MAAMYSRSRSVLPPMALARSTAAHPRVRAFTLGGSHSGYHRLIAAPQ